MEWIDSTLDCVSFNFLFRFSATRTQSDDAYKKDYKYMLSEKENVAAKRDTERLILAKDSGKMFTSGGVQLGGGQSGTLLPPAGQIFLATVTF